MPSSQLSGACGHNIRKILPHPGRFGPYSYARSSRLSAAKCIAKNPRGTPDPVVQTGLLRGGRVGPVNGSVEIPKTGKVKLPS